MVTGSFDGNRHTRNFILWDGPLMARILYFAWVREKMGVAEERVTLPETVHTITQLTQMLRARDPRFDQALSDPSLRVAVNQEHAQPETLVTDQDEIAFFPPVSGG